MPSQPSPEQKQYKCLKFWLKLLLIFICTVLLAQPALAHPGRTAADGCHYCRTNCSSWGVAWNQRHCHGGSSSGSSSSTDIGIYKYGDKYYLTRPTIDVSLARLWEGKTILNVFTGEWYLVKNLQKHLVPDWQTAEIWGLRHCDAIGFTHYDIQRIEAGEQLKFWEAPMLTNNKNFLEKWEGKTILDVRNGKMYLVRNWQKHYVPDFLTMISWGLIYEDATGFGERDLLRVPDGEQLKYWDGLYFIQIEICRDSQFACNDMPFRLYAYIQDNYNRVKWW